MIDFKRLDGLIDLEVMRGASIAGIGAGGAASLYVNLARLGIGKLTICDFDTVSATNPATQAYGVHETGRYKVHALADQIAAINPECKVTPIVGKVESLRADHAARMFGCDLVLAMTDDFMVQAGLNRIACKRKIDMIFAGGYPNGSAVEIVGTFRDAVEAGRGCQRCYTFPRYQAFANGYQDPAKINSQIFQAELRNALLGHLIVSLLHMRAGSSLGNPNLARRFIKNPLLITRIDPAYAAAGDEAFADTPQGFGLFTSRQWPRDLPPGFVCADCGASPDAATGSDDCGAPKGKQA